MSCSPLPHRQGQSRGWWAWRAPPSSYQAGLIRTHNVTFCSPNAHAGLSASTHTCKLKVKCINEKGLNQPQSPGCLKKGTARASSFTFMRVFPASPTPLTRKVLQPAALALTTPSPVPDTTGNQTLSLALTLQKDKNQ